MIFIDAREGVSADMLLAAMIGLVGEGRRGDIVNGLASAGGVVGLSVHLEKTEEVDERGLAISYSGERPETHRRTLGEVREILAEMHSAQSVEWPSSCDIDIATELFRAEATAHSSTIEEVHLHEAGRPSGLLNIFGIGLVHGVLKAQGAGDFECSTITTGKGIVVIGHGAVRVPTPASAELLKGLMHTPGSDPGERATPTGLAAIRAMVSRQSDQAPVSHISKSIGYGTRRFGGRLGKVAMYLS